MISQYANSTIFSKLDANLTALFNEGALLDDWYQKVMNVETASGFGLDVWGSIIGQSRVFEYDGVSYYLQGEQTIDGIHYTYNEMEELYRLALKLKALSNISNFSIDSINNLLMVLFQNKGMAYCLEVPDDSTTPAKTGTMTIRFVFRFFASKVEKAIIESLAPHPTGVAISGFEYLPKQTFMGFFTPNKTADEQPWTPLNDGPYYKYR